MACFTEESSNFDGWVSFPRGFNKTFSKAGEGQLDEFSELLKVGAFSLGDPHDLKHYHSILIIDILEKDIYLNLDLHMVLFQKDQKKIPLLQQQDIL